MPAMAGTFSVPARRLRSWRPPVTNGSSRTPRRIHSAPMPFGPPNLCAEIVSRSTPSARTSTGILPAVCTASVWKSAPRLARQRGQRRRPAASCRSRYWRASPTRAAVRSVSALAQGVGIDDAARADRQQGHVASRAWRGPSPSAARLRARCWTRSGGAGRSASSASAAPRIAALSPSVPPAVKTSFGRLGADQRGHRGPGVVEHRLGLLAEMVDARGVAPHVAAATAVNRSSAAGARGVVALWSR